MNHKQMTFNTVSKDYAIHIIGEDVHNYLVERVLMLKKSTHREFVDSMGNKKYLRLVPMGDTITYFIDDSIVA